MGIFNFWKTKIDLNNLLYHQEKLTSNKLFEIIIGIRKHLATPVGYDEENSFGMNQETNIPNYEKYSDELFSQHIKFLFEEEASKNEKGEWESYESQLINISNEIFDHSIKRANVEKYNLTVLTSKNDAHKVSYLKQVSILKSTKNIIFNFCSNKSLILNKQLTQNEIDNTILKLILATIKEIV